MLEFDINHLFKLKGITKKAVFLRNHGFSESISNSLAYHNRTTLSVKNIEMLCNAFNCTPNDIFTYTESVENPLPKNSVLKSLVREPLPTLRELVSDLSAEQAADLIEKIKALKSQ